MATTKRRLVVVCGACAFAISASASPPVDLHATLTELQRMAVEPGGTNHAYATRQLVALARVGVIAPTDDVLLKALRSQLADQIHKKQLMQGAETLDTLGVFDGEGILWRLNRMQLLGAAGRLDLADYEYDELGRTVAGDHSLRDIRTVLGKVRALLKKRSGEEDVELAPLHDRLRMWVEAVEKGMEPQDAAPVSSMIQDAAKESMLLNAADDLGLLRVYWLVMDEALRRSSTNELASLRASQAVAAETDLKLARKHKDPTALLDVWRRFPWARESNRALLDYGTRMLGEGRLAAAALSFKDVLDHAADETLLKAARTGLSLCHTGRESQAKINTPLAGGPGPVKIQLPPVCTHHPALLYARSLGDNWLPMRWPMVTIQFSKDRVLAAGPALLACYASGNTTKPVWKHVLQSPWITGGRKEDIIIPDMAFPALDEGRVYARWGRRAASGDIHYDLMVDGNAVPASRLRRQHTGYAAFDLRTGRTLWSTAGKPYWEDMIAIGDPVVDSHSVYLAGTSSDVHSLNSDQLEFIVCCVDKTTGNLCWKRSVGWIRPYLKPGQPSGNARMPGFNTRLTLADGKLYSVSGNGLITCQDLRDGMPLWIRDEPGFRPVPAAVDTYVQRPNHFALVHQSYLVVAPRDRPGVAVLDRTTGQTVWDKPWLPSITLALLPRDRLLLQDAHNLLAVKLEDGSTVWRRSFEQFLRGPAQVDASGVHVVVGTEIQRLDAISGHTLDRSPAPEDGLVSISARHGGISCYATYEGGTGGADRAHFVDTGGDAHLQRRVPRLYVPEPASPLSGRIYLVAEGFIECVDAEGAAPRWRRAIRPDFMQPVFSGNDVLLAARNRVVAVDGQTGKTRWQLAVPDRDGSAERVLSWHMIDGLCVAIAEKAMMSFDPLTGRAVCVRPLPARRHMDRGVANNAFCIVGEVRKIDQPTRSAVTVLMISPRDGREIARYALPVLQHIGSAFTDDAIWVVGDDRHVYHVKATNGEVTRSERPVLSDADMKSRRSRQKIRVPIFAADGEYALLDGNLMENLRAGDYASRPGALKEGLRRWVYKSDGSSFTPGGTRNFFLGDGLICEARNRRLRVAELATGKERYVCTIPVGHEVVDVQRDSGVLRVVSSKRVPKRAESPVNTHHYRVDLFHDSNGQRMRGRALPDVRSTSWKLRDGKGTLANQFAWLGDTLFVTDEHGLHAVPMDATSYAKLEVAHELVYRAPGALSLDGKISEAEGLDLIEPTDALADSRARGYVTHDQKFLYIGVSYVNPDPIPIMERGRLVSTGDRLEMELRTNLKPSKDKPWPTYQWNAGLSSDGHSVFTRDAPLGLRGVVNHDMESGVWTCEIVIPLKSIQDEMHARQADMRLTVNIRDDAYGDIPAARWHRLPLRLHAMTRTEETAGLAIASRLPSLNESQWFIKNLLEAHVTDWPIGRRTIEDLLREHRNSAFAAWVLRYLDKRIETRTGLRAFSDLRSLAEKSGLGPELLEWYDRYPSDLEKDPTKVMPWADNTVMPEPDPISRDALMTLFKTHIPDLGPTDTANRFFSAFVREIKASPEEEISLVTWYLQTFPRHPRIRNFLEGVWEVARKENEKDAVARVEKVLEESGIAGVEKYRFRRTATHMDHARVLDWHVVGPFPSLLIDQELGDTILPKHQGRITLKEHYRLTNRRLRWKYHHTDTGVVDMRAIIDQPFVKAMAYAVAWVKPPQAGKAILEVGSFGPCSVWINNRLVYHTTKDSDDAWLPKGYKSKGRFPVRAVPVMLPANWSMVLVENTVEKRGWQFGLEFVDAEGKGPIRGVEVMRPEGPGHVLVEEVPLPPILPGGLRAEYFDDRDLSDLKVVRKDPSVDFSWNLESPDPRVDWDEFSVRWTGWITPRYTEPYTFTIQGNDGVRLWIDGKLLVDHWKYHGGLHDRARVVLYAGRQHHIRLEHYEQTDHADMHMWWESASQSHEIVPAECLSSSWYLVDTIIAPPDPTNPVGVPRFYGMRVRPRQLWLQYGGKYRFTAIPVNQYGDAIDPESHFDDKGQPIDTSVKWKVIPGGYLNLYHQYGGAAYLPNKHKKAKGVIDDNGLFISDGSRGVVTIVAESAANPNIRGTAVMAVDDIPAIGPHRGQPMTIGKGFQGDIDRCRIYTKALSGDQIVKHANGEKLSNIGLLGDWTFDEMVDGKFPNMAGGEGLEAEIVSQSVRHMKDEDGSYLVCDRGSVEVADDPRLNFSQRATLEAWVRTSNGGLVIDRCRWGTVQGFRLKVHGREGLLCQGNFGHGSLEVQAKLSPFVWNHIVAVYGESGLRQLWANGKKVGERKGGPQVMEW